jgi:flagellar hook-length control protein FliK
MTTLPILPGPAPAPLDAGPAGTAPGTPESGAAFAALVDLNLEPQPQPQPQPQQPQPEQPQSEQPAPEPQPAVLPWSGLLIASAPVQQVVVEAAAGGPVDADGATDEPAGDPGHEPAADAATVLAQLGINGALPLPGVPVTPVSGGAPVGTPPGVTSDVPATAASPLSHATGDAAAQPQTGPAPSDDVAPTPVVTTTAAGPVQVPGGGSGPAVPVQQAAVTSQVFPEVARLVSRGDGTHRITFRLTPDNLGEVRIVLTVRDGAVQVAMTASAAAQEALRSGSQELHRLLESVGASSSQIKVSDAGSTANTTISTSGAGVQDGFTQPGSDGAGRHDQAPDHRAWMRASSTSARDGGRPGAASLPDPTNPDTSRPASGVDVTM